MKKEYTEPKIEMIEFDDSICTEGGQEWSICTTDICTDNTWE